MPNELGLLSKQEAKNVRDLNAIVLGASDYIREIAELIKSAQTFSYTQTEITLNRVYPTDLYTEIEKYYKNTMSYIVDFNTTNLPAGQTRLVRISWA